MRMHHTSWTAETEDGWTVECSCGWSLGMAERFELDATSAWERHVAAVQPPEPTPAEPRRRANYLTTVQFDRLRDWGRILYAEIGHMPYLVGSSLTRPDWRDVDIRIIVDDAPGWYGPFLRDRRGHFLLSLWGQQATGLPIDCQFQTTHEANAIEGARHAIGIIVAADRDSEAT